jgi:hypothetical protein
MRTLLNRFVSSALPVFLTAILLLSALPVLSQQTDEVFPPCFNESELAKVREWEKTWVGKKVNAANVDQVKDFLPDILVTMMKEPEKWGAKELWFEVVPYQFVPQSKTVAEATKKYSPQSKFSPNGFKTPAGDVAPNEFLEGYEKGEQGAGFPFPKAKTGLEMAWNYDSLNYGDHWFRNIAGPSVNARTGAERKAYQPQWVMMFSGRTDMPPTPMIQPNKRGIRVALYMEILDPPDMYGTHHLDIQYMDPRKENDAYIWIAMYRRVRKLSTSQRSDTIDGTDENYDDHTGYYNHVNRNTWKFLETKEVIGSRHMKTENYTRQHGQAFWSGLLKERCKVHLLEFVNKDKEYVYSKAVMYLDTETYQCLYKETWDRQGKLWRFFVAGVGIYKSVQGNQVIAPVGYNYVDVQRLHGGPNNFGSPKFGGEMKPDMFTLQYLQRVGY